MTKEWFAEQGSKGGKKTKALYGSKHFRKINPRTRKVDKFSKPKKALAKQVV